MSRILLLFGLAVIVASSAFGANDDSIRTNLSITARVLGADSQPCKGSMTFWQAIEDGGQAGLPDHFRDMSERAQRWTDRVTGKTWKPIYHYGVGEEATLAKLTPGDYRVAAALGNGPAPFGVSEVIHLDGTIPRTDVVIRLQAGSALTVSAVDGQTQKPIAQFQAMLVRDDGFPVTRWSMSPWALWSREQEGRLDFSPLAPDNYRLEVRRPAFYANQPEYSLEHGSIAIQVVAGVDQQITARLQATALPDEVIRERWPFVVTGRVTDERGEAVDGVTITAHCGVGSLRPTGQTASGPDGRYTLRFTGGMWTMDGNRRRLGLQAATISPGKPGYVEANLHRQGNLLMAERMPGPNEDTGWKVEPGKVVLPNQPFPLNFVLLPAATLKGQLLDAQNRPMAAERIYLSGTELPPSTSVLADTQTDADGRFQFDNVPPRRAWWFSLPGHRDARSPSMTFEQAGEHRVRLRLASQAGQPALELADTRE